MAPQQGDTTEGARSSVLQVPALQCLSTAGKDKMNVPKCAQKLQPATWPCTSQPCQPPHLIARRCEGSSWTPFGMASGHLWKLLNSAQGNKGCQEISCTECHTQRQRSLDCVGMAACCRSLSSCQRKLKSESKGPKAKPNNCHQHSVWPQRGDAGKSTIVSLL